MEIYFNHKYRIASARHPHWDYTWPGWYFVTIVTSKREPFFGTVYNGRVELTELGEIAQAEWKKTAMIRRYVMLDEFVFMPDHMHGIVVICEKPVFETMSGPGTVHAKTVTTAKMRAPVETSRRDVSTGARGDCGIMHCKSKIPRLQPDSLGSIICQYKSVTTKRIRAVGHRQFAWQSRYHDHIIRNGPELERIRRYIRENPENFRKN
jgi:putative transposase